MLFRYPGSKNKIASRIIKWFSRYFDGTDQVPEYREPFFGGGSVGLSLLERYPMLRTAWLNDSDASLCCVWRAVIGHSEELIKSLMAYQRDHLDAFQKPREKGRLEPEFKPREKDMEDTELVEYLTFGPKVRCAKKKGYPQGYLDYVKDYLAPFYKMQEEVRNGAEIVPDDVPSMIRIAFSKIAIHQTSFSGVGVETGPIGGKEQLSQWIMGCRFTPETTAKKILQIQKLMKGRVREETCTNLDFMELLKADGDCVFYLDPPYYEQGHKLYLKKFGLEKHEALRDHLRHESRPWLLSYDNCEKVKGMYRGKGIYLKDLPLRYTITKQDIEKTELVITNQPYTLRMFAENWRESKSRKMKSDQRRTVLQ